MRKLAIFTVIFLLLISLANASVGSMVGESGQLQATLISQLPDPVEPGNNVELRFNVQNLGGTINDVVFELLPENGLTLTDDGVRNIGTILARQFKEDAVSLYFKLKIESSAPAGNATVKLRYKVRSGAYTQFDKFYIKIREPQAFLTIDSIVTEPAELMPGKTGHIIFGLTNYAKFTMRNIWITLNSSVFSGYGSANEKYIAAIEPGKTVYQTFDVIVSGDAASNVYNTPITLDYRDDIGTRYLRDLRVGLIVNEQPNYLMNIEESTIFYENQVGDVVFSISNTGIAEMKFATLELRPAENGAYEVISSPKAYVGNLESDDFETVSYKVHVNGVKDSVPFRLLLRYKDNFNSNYNDDHELLFKIYTKSKAGQYGLAEVPGFMSYLITLMIIVLIIVFTVFMVLDWMHNPMPRYKRILWLIVILTPGIGSLAYYFFGRKKAEL